MAKMEKEWEVTTERFVAFFDIMGFKDRVYKYSHQEILEDLRQMKRVIKKLEETYDSKKNKAAIFSDSIVLFTEDNSKESLNEIIYCCSILMAFALTNNIPIKGALSCGKVTADISESIFFGKPIIDAYLLNEELFFYGVVVDEHVEKKIIKYEIEKLNIEGLYQCVKYHTPFKFGKAFHYTINWTLLVDIFLKGEEEENPFIVLNNLSFTMSGKPRIYLDNTIEYFTKYYAPPIKK